MSVKSDNKRQRNVQVPLKQIKVLVEARAALLHQRRGLRDVTYVIIIIPSVLEMLGNVE